jgi:hypothetical protein
MKQPAITWQGDNMIIVGDDYIPHTINRNTHPNYMEIVKCIQEKRWDDIADLIDVRKNIKNWSNGNVSIDNDEVKYRGRPVPDALGEMLKNLIKNKIDCEYFVKFTDNLMQNPSNRSVEQLYQFLERNHMPITEDGCFMAYKAVDPDYMSYHCDEVTGEKVRYMIGDKPNMPRNLISDDFTLHCHRGLHACSMEYLKQWSAVHLMIVKINPKDVVCVPNDCNFSKMRVCEMEVMAEIFNDNGDPWYTTRNTEKKILEDQYNDDAPYTEDEIERIREEAFEQGRDVGYQSGYDDGRDAGFDEGQESLGD